MRRFVEQSVITSLVPRLKRSLIKEPPLRHNAPFVRASVAAVFRWKETEQQSLELLFVRRSVNKNDIWSGQIAFPGGRRQKKTQMDLKLPDSVSDERTDDWESLRETAQRETFEEVGLDLTTKHVHWIGNLSPIESQLIPLSVSTQVYFIDTAADEHNYKPKVHTSEIADVFWVDVQELYNPQRYNVLSYPIEDALLSLRLHPRVLAMIKKVLGNMLFDCIYLPRPNRSPPDEECLPRDMHDFVLWGLTLRAVVMICAAADAPLPIRLKPRHFDSKLIGDVVLYCLQYSDKIIAGTATLSILFMFGLVYSNL
ncbi:putative NUDIX hydrolase domain-containing protein [Plasmopara halstedii]